MADYPIDFQLVADPVTFQRAANAAVTVYDINDASNTTPLALKDLNGLVIANPLTSTAEAITPPFLSPAPDIKLVGGGYTIPVSSAVGLRNAAQASALAAQTAVADAQAAKTAATSAAALVNAPADQTIAAAVQGANTETRAALEARYAGRTTTETALGGKVGKGDVAVRLADYAPAADGAADDTAKILAAANDAVAKGLPLIFDGTKRYAVAGLVFPANLRMQTYGCTFVKTANNNTYAIRTGDSFHADSLKLEVAGGASNEAGVFVNGSDTVIDRIKVTSLTTDQPGANALLVGDLTTARSNIRINGITLTGFRSPMRVINVADSRFNNATISNFQTGVYVVDVKNTTFDKFRISGTSASSTGGPGQNGILLEAQAADSSCINLRFRDWLVDGAPEHAYRIGGSFTVADIIFEGCISRNPGNAPGNAATGGAAFKVLGVAGHLHYNIRYINCTAEDGNTSASGINNHAQYHFGFVDGLAAINPTLRARNKTYSGQIGILLFACKNVDIVQPSIRDVNRQSLYMIKDSTEASPPTGVQRVRITGGLVDSLNVNNVIALDAQSSVFKDIFVDNLIASRGSSALRVETPTTAGADVGSYSNVNVKIRYIDAPTGSTTAPITGGNLTVNDYTGPIYGSASIPSLDGGTYLNAGTGARYIRKAGAWTQQ